MVGKKLWCSSEYEKFTDLNTFKRWLVKKYGTVTECKKFTELNTFEVGKNMVPCLNVRNLQI